MHSASISDFTSPFLLKKHFDPAPGPLTESGNKYWFLFHDDKLCLNSGNGKSSVAFSKSCPVGEERIRNSEHIGTYDGSPCFAVALTPEESKENLEEVSLRQAHSHLDSDLWVIAGRAQQILQWRNDNRYCGRCGSLMVRSETELVMKCSTCDFTSYPRISPAVIMSVTRGDKILLGRSPRFPEGMYSTLAGFVEPGETLEEAVRREVREETGIEVTNVRYIASQPWPFPNSLMLGFTADYASGEIGVDGDELEDAGWFSPQDMPRLPTRLSIARMLIEMYLDNSRGNTR